MLKNSENIKFRRDLLLAQMREYCPILGDFFALEKSLQEYSADIYKFEKNQIYISRQSELKQRIVKLVENNFGSDAIKKLHIQFDDQMALNIVDHSQILNHPILISNNVMSSIGKFMQVSKPSATLVFSSGDVPPNNYFSRNGFMLHNKKVPLFSNSEKEFTSYYLPKREFDFIKRLKDQKRWADFDGSEQDFLQQMNDLINSLNFSGCENYNDQVAVIVNKTWPLMFEEKMRPNLAELIYVTQEEITRVSLLELLKEDNFITQTLFDNDFRKLILDEFRGIVVTWRENEGKGTHFFWRKHPTEPKPLRMFLQGNKLVPYNEKYKELAIDFDRDTLLFLLKKKEIYPSLFLIFAVNIFYYGVKPLVGHGSLTYLNMIRDTWLKILPKSGFPEEVKNIKTVHIDYMICGISLFDKFINGNYTNMYAHDVMSDGGIKQAQLEKLFKINFKDLLSINVNEIYDYVKQKYIPQKKKIKPKFINQDYASLVYK